jgi:hypothetical protein
MADVVVEPLAGDPYWANTVFLCHFDGTNGSTTLADTSTSAHVTTCSGSVSLSTTSPKFGTASLGCTTSSNAYAHFSDKIIDVQFGSGQFTVEGWIYYTTAAGNSTVVAQWNAAGGQSWFLGTVSGNIALYYSTTGSDNPNVGAAWTPTINTWYHIAADRNASNVLRVYVNGTVMASATIASTFFASTTSDVTVGSTAAGNLYTSCRVDDVRITKGVARYAGAFTAPSTPFPDGAASTNLALGATEAADSAAFAAMVSSTLQLSLAATETTDVAHFNATVTQGIVTVTLAAREAVDHAAFATLKVGYDLSQVWVTLLAPHEFSAVYWLANDVLSPSTYVPPDFYFTPLMRGENAYSATQIQAVKDRMTPFALQEFFAMSKVINYNYASPQVH